MKVLETPVSHPDFKRLGIKSHAFIMRGFRRKRNMNQQQAATFFDTSQSYISKVESQTLELTVPIFAKIMFECYGETLYGLATPLIDVGIVDFVEQRERRKKKGRK